MPAAPTPEPPGGASLEQVAASCRDLSARIAQAGDDPDHDWAAMEAKVTRVGAQLVAHADALAEQRIAEATEPEPTPEELAEVDNQCSQARVESMQAKDAWRNYATEHNLPLYVAPLDNEEAMQHWQAKLDAVQRLSVASDRRITLREHGRRVQQAHNQIRADAYREVLSAVRPMGGTIDTMKGTHREAATLLQEAAASFPTAWVEASNRAGGLKATRIKTRAHYAESQVSITRKLKTGDHGNYVKWRPDGWQPDPDDPQWQGWKPTDRQGQRRQRYSTTVERLDEWYGPSWKVETLVGDEPPEGYGWEAVATGTGLHGEATTTWRKRLPTGQKVTIHSLLTTDGGSTTGHEFTHRCEHMLPQIGKLSEEFLQRRTTLPNGTREPLVPYQKSRTERVRPDNFADVYMGKQYKGTQFHEVMSTGTEALFHGRFGGLLGQDDRRRDDDMRHFVLGVMATA